MVWKCRRQRQVWASTGRLELPTLGPLPSPPVELASVELPIVELAQHWFRSHPVELGPIFYGQNGQSRFDDPERGFGVLYLAEDQFGAFAETFAQLLSAQSRLPRMISSGALSTLALSELVCDRPLRLVDLSGPGLARIGADARLCAGDHEYSRPWSKALREHPAQVDGLYYPVRHDLSRRAAAVFNEDLVWTTLARESWLSMARMVHDVLDEYQFALIESSLVQKAVKKGPQLEQASLGYGGGGAG